MMSAYVALAAFAATAARADSMADAMEAGMAAGMGACNGQGSNPARYNFAIGPATAAVLSDGNLGGPIEDTMAFRDSIYVQKRALRNARLPDDTLTIAKNILYVDTGDDKILFDTGIGAAAGGTLLQELEGANVNPEEITKVMITHGHPDHIGGIITTGGDLIYPNAEYYISEAEWEYWRNETVDPREFTQERIDGQAAVAKPVFAAIEDRVTLFGFNKEIVPGVSVLQTTYHTPGSAVYVLNFTAGAEPPFYVSGDSLTHVVLSVENPWFLSGFDSLPGEGPKGRYQLLGMISREKARVSLYHGAYPGVGEVDAAGMELRWYGDNYELMAGVVTMCPAMEPEMAEDGDM